MKISKIPCFTVLLITLFLFPSSLLSQKDLSVDFVFNRPNELVCKIRNLTDHKISIIFSRQRTPLFFDILKSDKDTLRYQYYELWKDVDMEDKFLYLDSGKVYAVSYNESTDNKFLKAYISIDYMVRDSAPKVKLYRETFDLNQIRNEVKVHPKVKDEFGLSIFHELSDDMLIQPDRNLMANDLWKKQQFKSFKYFAEIENITKEDIDKAVIINLIQIFPDEDRMELKYKVDDDYFLIHIPTQDHIFSWEKSSSRFSVAEEKYSFSSQLCKIIKKCSNSNGQNFFLFSFFPKEHRKLEYIMAFNNKDNEEYSFRDILYEESRFYSFESVLRYYFYSVPFYTEIYKYRFNNDYPAGWSCIY